MKRAVIAAALLFAAMFVATPAEAAVTAYQVHNNGAVGIGLVTGNNANSYNYIVTKPSPYYSYSAQAKQMYQGPGYCTKVDYYSPASSRPYLTFWNNRGAGYYGFSPYALIIVIEAIQC